VAAVQEAWNETTVVLVGARRWGYLAYPVIFSLVASSSLLWEGRDHLRALVLVAIGGFMLVVVGIVLRGVKTLRLTSDRGSGILSIHQTGLLRNWTGRMPLEHVQAVVLSGSFAEDEVGGCSWRRDLAFRDGQMFLVDFDSLAGPEDLREIGATLSRSLRIPLLGPQRLDPKNGRERAAPAAATEVSPRHVRLAFAGLFLLVMVHALTLSEPTVVVVALFVPMLVGWGSPSSASAPASAGTGRDERQHRFPAAHAPRSPSPGLQRRHHRAGSARLVALQP
jgi:hypothetical protein